MKFLPTWLKRPLSHLIDVPENQGQSQFSGHLELFWRRGELCLSQSETIYSFGRHYHNFDQVFQELQAFCKHWQKILVLGAGMASIPRLLELNYHYRGAYVLVEIDPLILTWAKTYLQLRGSAQWVAADAWAFVQNDNTHYDFIAVDVFIGASTPAIFFSPDFLQQIQTLLQPQAWLVYNTLCPSNATLDQLEQFWQDSLNHNWAQTKRLHLGPNQMLLYQKT